MRVKKITVRNFRCVKEQSFEAKDLSMFIGDNATGKTSILEAVNFALSPHFLSGRIKHSDFRDGGDDSITIDLEFDSEFTAGIPDGYIRQEVSCRGIHLEVKRRERAGPGKAFSGMTTLTHHVVPSRQKDSEKGWEQKRKGGSLFKFDERRLSVSQVELEGLPRSFYFEKSRGRQLQRGFNSSISSILEDFNWRFSKSVRGDEGGKFFSEKDKFEKEILSRIEGNEGKSLGTLNDKLRRFNIPEVDLSFIDGGAPFDRAFLSRKLERLDLPVTSLGSGIEMIVSLLFLETLASLSKERITVLIDEPELHLHPLLQEKFSRYLIEFSKENQVFVSTHSPYFFKNCLNNDRVEPMVTKNEGNETVIENAGSGFRLFPWSPSWGEINYSAYGLPTEEFHNELYGYLQRRQKDNSVEAFFEGKKVPKSKQWIKYENGEKQPPKDVTLMTFIRHSMHHPENPCNEEYTPEELKSSIDQMMRLIESDSENEDDSPDKEEKQGVDSKS